MNKQDLRYAYLNYFKNQFMKNELIESKTLLEMAPNGKIAKDVINELVQEGLVEGIHFVDGEEKNLSLFLDEVVNLTEKGREEINKMISPKKLAEHTEKEGQSSRLSNEDKYHLIIKEILVFFYELSLEPCLLFDDAGNFYTLYKIRGELHKIVEKYFKTSNYHLEYILNKRLYKENLIRYRYGKKYIKDNEEIGIKNFITKEGIKYLEKEYSYCPKKPLGQLTEKEYFSTYGNIVPRISSNLSKLAEGPDKLSKQIEKQFVLLNNIQKYAGLNSTALKLAQQFGNLSSLKAVREATGIYSRITDGTPIIRATEGFQNLVPSNMQKASNEFFQHRNQEDKDINEENKEDNINDDTNKIYTFEGILGQNCGEVVTPTSEDIKRIQEKGFKVENGIKVLRGFANSAILALTSQKDGNYQRKEDPGHLIAIERFVENMRTSAKYLPEVTLIARGYKKLEKINLSGTLSEKQRGEIQNLEYYKLTVSKNNLYRIDGNHRLEALKKDNYYISFSIIIWEDVNINPDDEAFLFYFLNNKAKKLTTEENLKGLVSATTWKPHELLEAHKYLPHLRYLDEQINTNKFLSSYFCNNEPIKNIAEILEKIEGNIEFNQFQEIISLTNELLILDKWNKLKQFNFYCQLVFFHKHIEL